MFPNRISISGNAAAAVLNSGWANKAEAVWAMFCFLFKTPPLVQVADAIKRMQHG